MNADHTHPLDEDTTPANGFDAHARACHGASLQRLSARAQARLAQARRPAVQPAPHPRAAWAVPTAFAAIAVLAIAMQLRPAPRGTAAATPPVATVATTDAASPDPAAALDENPDFYLWLASNDDTLPTTPEY
jgi:hypothetical protein